VHTPLLYTPVRVLQQGLQIFWTLVLCLDLGKKDQGHSAILALLGNQILRLSAQRALNLLHYKTAGFVFCFNTSRLSKEEENNFFYYMSTQHNVFAVKKMLGTWNFKNYVFVKKMEEIHSLIKEIKEKFANIVYTYETWVVYKETHLNPFPKVLLSIVLNNSFLDGPKC